MPYADPVKRKSYHAAYWEKWSKDNSDKITAAQRRHDQKRKTTEHRKKQVSDHRVRRHARQRLDVLERYGECRCAFCDDGRYEILTIDHIEKDGAAHRKQFYGKYRNLYDFLARTEFRPDRYRVLCWNCHMAMTRYGVEPGGKEFKPIEEWREFAKAKKGWTRKSVL